MIKLHIVNTSSGAHFLPLARIRMPWWSGAALEQIKGINHATNVGYGSGTVLLQSTSDYFVWISPPQFALEKNNHLFKLEIPLHLNFKCAANTL